jgi:hypothetical protein
MINPFVLAWAPYTWPGFVGIEVVGWVVGVTLALSAVLVAYTVRRLRADMTGGSGQRLNRLTSWLATARARLSAWRPGPSLDRDPVLWREWRRGRPSRLARVVWGMYIALASAGTALGIYAVTQNYGGGHQFLSVINGLEATFGLLLVSLAAPTVLAEERVRGSLDVLMATPLSTDRIVLAKWWGAFRVVPSLALLPAIGAIIIAAGELNPGFRRGGSVPPPIPLDTIDRLALACLPVALFLVQGAAVTSLGLALATWVRRLGRAVATSVTLYALSHLAGLFSSRSASN